MRTEHIQFNEHVLMYIIHLDGKPVINVIEEVTHLNAGKFIPNISVQSMCNKFFGSWCNVYIGMPNRILIDQGNEFGEVFIPI